jgi:MFS family permease
VDNLHEPMSLGKVGEVTAAEEPIDSGTRYRDALGVPAFRGLFTGYVISMLGDVLATLALTVLVYEQTQSPLLAALVFTAYFVPYLIGSAGLSALVDRIPPRRLLVGCDLIAAVLAALMAIPGLPVGVLLLMLATIAVLGPLPMGARGGLLPVILPGDAYLPGRSLMRVISQLAQIVGNAVGGLLLLVLGARQALLIDATSFLISACIVGFSLRAEPAALRAGAEAREAGLAGGLGRDSLRGALQVLSDRDIRRVLVYGWVIPMVGVAPEALGIAFLAQAGEPSHALGWWLAGLPTGVLIGEVTAIWFLPPRYRVPGIRPLSVLVFLPLLFLVVIPPLSVAVALLVLAGLGSAYTLGLDILGLQVTAEPLRPRMFTISSAGLMSLQGLGFTLAGVLGSLLSPRAAIGIAAVLGLILSAALRLPRAEVRTGRLRWGSPS